MTEEADRDIDLVLVTGAGASHEFGVNHTKVPLMGAWSDALVDKIAGRSWSYLETTGLQKGLTGPDFEKRLGQFLRMAQSLPSISQVLKPSLEFQAPPGNMSEQSLREWHQITVHHVGQILDLIHESLYESFSYERMDLDAAAQAYGTLLQQLGINNTTSMVYATTNYDIVGEYVIERLEGLPDWGEQRRLILRGESPLRVDGLLAGMPRYVPILHLHGRIGWYRRDGGRPVSGDQASHHADFGVPILMLPDPDKAYDSDPVITSIWSQFEEALRRARRVLVLGHSLNDEPLVAALKQNVTPAERVAVTVRGEVQTQGVIHPADESMNEMLARELPAATVIPIHFAQNAIDIQRDANEWNSRVESKVASLHG